MSNFAKVPICIGFAWPGFFSRRATGMALVRRLQKLPTAETMPPDSRTNGPLAKAGPIKHAVNVFGVTNLSSKKSYCTDVIAATEKQDENT